MQGLGPLHSAGSDNLPNIVDFLNALDLLNLDILNLDLLNIVGSSES